jgi:hypothetical protein
VAVPNDPGGESFTPQQASQHWLFAHSCPAGIPWPHQILSFANKKKLFFVSTAFSTKTCTFLSQRKAQNEDSIQQRNIYPQ